MALLRESDGLLAAGKKTEALALIQHASIIAPNSLQPPLKLLRHTLTGKMIREKGPGLISIIKEITRILTANPLQTMRLAYNAGMILFSINLLVFVVLMMALLWRVGRTQLHALQHLLPKQLPAYFFIIVFLALAYAAGISLGCLSIFAIVVVIIWRLISTFEKTCLFVLLLLLLAQVVLYQRYSSYLALAITPWKELQEVTSGVALADKALEIKKFTQQYPKEIVGIYSLALAEKIANHSEASMKLVNDIIGRDNGYYQAHILKGNLLYLQKNYKEALPEYLKAISLNPSSTLALYNLSKIYYNEAELEPGNETMKKARESNPVEFSRLEDEYRQAAVNGIHLFDPPIATEEVLKSIQKNSSIEFPKRISVNLLLLFAIFVALMLFHVFRGKRSHAIACEKCGNTNCPKCHSAGAEADLCAQCYNLYIKKVTIDPELKINKEREIRLHKQRKKVFASMATAILPGTGNIYLGHSRLGVMQLLISALLISWLLPIPFAPDENYLPIFHGFLIGVGLLALIIHYLLSFIEIVRN
jgi:tetratricopeptide (TPR) repeat protein